MIKKIFITSLIVGFLGLLGGVGFITYHLTKSYRGPDVTFSVRPGDTFGRVNQRLYDQGLISDRRVFHYYAQFKKALTKLRAGDYTLAHGANMEDVLNTLIWGRPNLISITIPEGKNIYEVAKLLEAAGITSEKDFLEAVMRPEIISLLQVQATSLEGYLFPETYYFSPETPANTVAKAMVDVFMKKTEALNFSHPFLNKHQVVTLASVVEKETGAKFERAAIAGVFTNRLKKRMRLESDPTTIYGIWHRYKGNIRKSDLLEYTPYNTYKIPALPRGPISNPGLQAIEAVLNPESHDFYFFVSKNDGTHIFTRNYNEHRNAVESFQKNARARQGKSWRDLKQ
jgi:UPF0755 protein